METRTDRNNAAPSARPASEAPVERRAVPRREATRLSVEDRERFEELKAKRPNPNVPPADMRTEDEEMEFRRLSAAVADADRAEAHRQDVRPNPKDRVAELKAKGELGEGETIDLRVAEELIAAEDRVAALKAQANRSPEEDEELARLQKFVADARASGGFDPNG